jgi:hypothetical protein
LGFRHQKIFLALVVPSAATRVTALQHSTTPHHFFTFLLAPAPLIFSPAQLSQHEVEHCCNDVFLNLVYLDKDCIGIHPSRREAAAKPWQNIEFVVNHEICHVSSFYGDCGTA